MRTVSVSVRTAVVPRVLVQMRTVSVSVRTYPECWYR